MKNYSALLFVFFCAVVLSACKGDGPPASAEEARELLVGKTWGAKDVGLLESSFRQNKGEPFIHTIQWLSTQKDMTPESREMLSKFLTVTLVLDENKTPTNDSGNVAHLEGMGLQEKQGYYFTSTQEENANDRTVRVYVVSIYPDGNIEKFPFTILQASGKRILLAAPPEMQPRNLVLALEAQ